MNTLFLLDTNVLAEPLKATPDGNVLASLVRYGTDCAVPAPVWHELYYGMRRLSNGRKRTMIKEFLETTVSGHLPVIPYDEAAAQVHGEFRAELEKQGRTLSFVDGQIGAIAVARRLTLVTRNTRDFQDIPGLKLQCWHAGG